MGFLSVDEEIYIKRKVLDLDKLINKQEKRIRDLENHIHHIQFDGHTNLPVYPIQDKVEEKS